MNLDGRVSIVTGAGSGIGQATALAFAKAGAKVLMVDINGDAAMAAAGEIGSSARGLRVDVTSEAEVEAMVKTAAEMGGLDIAVNCAGIDQPMAPIETLQADLFERIMRVNAFGVWLCMKHELLAMGPRQRGSIVNVSSVTGLVGAPSVAAYSASKHAVVGLTRCAALEYAQRGIRINAICPGGTMTPMVKMLYDDPQYRPYIEAGIKAHPIGRMATTAEIADAILFLASDRASFITGAALPVDGAYTVA